MYEEGAPPVSTGEKRDISTLADCRRPEQGFITVVGGIQKDEVRYLQISEQLQDPGGDQEYHSSDIKHIPHESVLVDGGRKMGHILSCGSHVLLEI